MADTQTPMARQAAIAMLTYPEPAPDPHSRAVHAEEMATLRMALCLAHGVDIDDIHPATGHDLSRRAYDSVRESWWRLTEDGGGELTERRREDMAEVREYWRSVRPRYYRPGDWPGAIEPAPTTKVQAEQLGLFGEAS